MYTSKYNQPYSAQYDKVTYCHCESACAVLKHLIDHIHMNNVGS